jgi:hypothetical protein
MQRNSYPAATHRLEVLMSCRALRLAGFFALITAPAAAQQSSRPYTEGPVTNVSYVRVKPGRFDDYMAFVSGPYKQLMEAEKKAGIITAWNVYVSPEQDKNDWNLILTTTYKNMAALDNLDDRTDPMLKQVMGSTQKSNEGLVSRGEMRDLVGTRLLRELILR